VNFEDYIREERMSLLVYSPKCAHCKQVIEFIHKHHQLKQLVTYHNINTQGLPSQYRNKITRVPTMLTKNGKFLVGKEITNFLESLLPSKEVTWCALGGGCSMTDIENNDTDSDIFSLDDYGKSLQPPMTKELEDKISREVSGVAYEDKME